MALSTTSTLDSAATLAQSSNVCEDKGESWDSCFFEEQPEKGREERFLDDIRNEISNVAVNHNTKKNAKQCRNHDFNQRTTTVDGKANRPRIYRQRTHCIVTKPTTVDIIQTSNNGRQHLNGTKSTTVLFMKLSAIFSAPHIANVKRSNKLTATVTNRSTHLIGGRGRQRALA